ncbi:acyl-CoA dehydrogenase family protein [Amycolatopsis sp. NBC_00355]|uniref:acyl-CoA dehydrogenase family protein n=1 Tax=Amycolatopsis sp. NBC_00355 TaxID=2975957 RepID=UPI002E261EF7
MDVPNVPAKVDPDALTAVLDGRWAELRRGVRAEMSGSEFRDPIDLDIEAHRAQVLDQLRALAATDRPGLGFDPAYGGGGDVGGSVTSFEMLGFGDLSLMVKAGVQWGLFGGAVQLLGTERHHAKYLREIKDLDLLGCFAMTEHGHGSDVQHLRTTATFADGGFVLHTPDTMAKKEYIGNAARDGRMAVVFAQLITGDESRGVHAFLVPIRDEEGNPAPGVSIEDCGPKAGLNGVDNGRLSFGNVRVPREALLNRFGDVDESGAYSSPIESDSRRFFTMLGALIRGRVSVGGSAGSATKRALALAVRYGEVRRQFTKPDGDEVVVLDYLAHQRKLLPALAKTYALHFAQEELVSKLHDIDSSAPEEEQRELESRAAGLKAANTWHATATIQTAREACGGSGYLSENLLAGLKADTDVFTTFEGDNTVLLQLVAKGLLTSFKQDFEDLSPLATARFFAEQVVSTVLERTSARKVFERLTEASDSDVFFRRDWQLGLFEDREEHVVEGVVKRLRKAGDDPFGVFNAAQDHVLRAGRVHVERLILTAFAAAVERCEDPEARTVLERVCDLYALSAIEEDLAWFLGHGRLSASRGKAVTAAVNGLCAELRPHARTLVDAFAIPEQFLRAPMLTS